MGNSMKNGAGKGWRMGWGGWDFVGDEGKEKGQGEGTEHVPSRHWRTFFWEVFGATRTSVLSHPSARNENSSWGISLGVRPHPGLGLCGDPGCPCRVTLSPGAQGRPGFGGVLGDFGDVPGGFGISRVFFGMSQVFLGYAG